MWYCIRTGNSSGSTVSVRLVSLSIASSYINSSLLAISSQPQYNNTVLIMRSADKHPLGNHVICNSIVVSDKVSTKFPSFHSLLSLQFILLCRL